MISQKNSILQNQIPNSEPSSLPGSTHHSNSVPLHKSKTGKSYEKQLYNHLAQQHKQSLQYSTNGQSSGHNTASASITLNPAVGSS